MLFSYNWLKEYIKGNLPKPDKLAEVLSEHIFEVESVKKVDGDYLFDIAILPNRTPDCLSYFGMAREISAITGLTFKRPIVKVIKGIKSKNSISVSVKNKSECLRYIARIIEGVEVKESPKFIKDKLELLGQNSINNIVDILNYVMLETGQPLHAFDFDKLKGKIIVRKAIKGEKITTLDNKDIELDEDILIIADSDGPLAIAGIKGGKKAEIDNGTKNIVIEAANFNYSSIRKASRKIGIRTDASVRFENRLDPNLAESAINRATTMINELAKGKVVAGMVDVYPKKRLPGKIILDVSFAQKFIGKDISATEMKKILIRLGFTVSGNAKKLTVIYPTYRMDILSPQDLIEEIARMYGYNNIPAITPLSALSSPKIDDSILWEKKTKNLMASLGFIETYNYSLIGDKEINIFGYKTSDMLEIENPTNIEQKYLRPSQICLILKNVALNFKHFDKIKIFELGKIFLPPKSEKRMLSGVIAQKGNKELFYEIKGTVDTLLTELGIDDFYYDEAKATPEESKAEVWKRGKTAEIKIGNKEIGFLGEISPKIAEEMGIKERVVMFDIDFEKLAELSTEENEYQPISQHPSAIRDLAVLVPLNTKVEEVLSIIEIAGGDLLKDTDVFDIYEGDKIPEGKKNLAFRLIFQADNRTLKSEEIDEIQNKIIKTIEENVEWEVRK